LRLWQVDTEHGEAGSAEADGAGEVAACGGEDDEQLVELRSILPRLGVGQEEIKQRLRLLEAPVQIRALCPLDVEREGQRVRLFPARLVDQRRGGLDIAERRLVRRGRLGPLARGEV
jgi:hypothetical protein